MCTPYRQLDPKARFRMRMGNVSLVVGLLLSAFVHPDSQIVRNWLHGICGFLLGISIAINLCALIRCRRKKQSLV